MPRYTCGGGPQGAGRCLARPAWEPVAPGQAPLLCDTHHGLWWQRKTYLNWYGPWVSYRPFRPLNPEDDVDSSIAYYGGLISRAQQLWEEQDDRRLMEEYR
ncbi:MAG: hypothetical protein Q8R28_10680 [Dehalococcoidia bacterium]|nr:hypothetical protein [Dehalococcoidia bacterium]